MKNITKILAVFGLLLAIFAFSSNAQARKDMPNPYQFINNLSLGSSGEDVVWLQTKLIELGFKIPAIENGSIDKGYFGGQTQSAVIHYQQSLGLPSTGFVGPLTRGILNSNSGNVAQSFVVSVDGPSSLSVGEVGTWTIKVKDQTQGTGNLSYSVNWSDAIALPANSSNSSSGVVPALVQTSTFTHSYTYASKYNANFMVFENGNLKGSVTLSINVTDPNKADIKVTSPNGGENFEKNSQTHIYWSNLGTGHIPRPVKVDIMLDAKNYSCPTCVAWYPAQYVLGKGVSNNGDFIWDISKDINNLEIRSNEQYKIKVCESGSSTNCDSSDGWFTISPAISDSIKIKVTSPNGGENWPVGTARTIVWNINNENSSSVTKVDIYLEILNACGTANKPCSIPLPYSSQQYVLDRNVDALASAKYNWLVGTDIDNKDIPPSDHYNIKICEAGTDNCDYSDRQFSISDAESDSLKINITSPNGGENWAAKSIETITWNVSGKDSSKAKVDLYLDSATIPVQLPYNCKLSLVQCSPPVQPYYGQYVLDKNISANTKYDWIVATDIDNNEIPNGAYRLRVCEAGNDTNCASSSNAFNIVNAIAGKNNPPVVTGITGPITLKVGEEGSWTISAYDTEREDLTYDIYTYATKTNRSEGVEISHTSSSNTWKTKFGSLGEYTTIITVSDKTGNITKVSITVNVF